MQSRDKGWDDRACSAASKIPQYDPLRDKNCPLTKSAGFKSHLLGVLKAEESQRSNQKKEGQGPGRVLQSSKRPADTSRREIRGSSAWAEVEQRMRSMTSGGITIAYQEEGAEGSSIREVDVLKNVVLREEYIGRLKVMAQEVRRRVPDGMGELLDMIRISSVETVESILKWRECSAKAGPFMWSGVNYLLKMASDLDFLDANRTIRQWLGFSVFRNPFVVPLPLEQLPALGDGAANQQDPQEASMRAAPGLPAYSTRDVSSLGREASSRTRLELSIRLKRRDVDAGKMLSVIGDLDMMRLRNAEKALLAEEATYMRLVRNAEGRVVPASLAASEVLRQFMSADNKRDVRLPARSHQYAAPLAELAGMGRVPRDNAELLTDSAEPPPVSYKVKSEPTSPVKTELAKAARGKVKEQQEGGDLIPFRAKGATGRKKGRTMRSQGAELDARTVFLKSELVRYQQTLDALRQQLASAKDEIARIDSADGPETQLKAESEVVGEHQKDTSARDSTQEDAAVRARRAEVEVLEKRVHRQEIDVTSAERRLNKRAADMDKLKSRELKWVNRRAAINIERKRRLLDTKALDFPEDVDGDYSVEDIAAVQIQRVVRGHQARVYAKKLGRLMHSAAARVQSVIRGFIVRIRFRKTVDLVRKVTIIQSIQRARLARRRAAEVAGAKRCYWASLVVSKLIVGYHGRVRFQRRRKYIELTQVMATTISPSELFPSDVQELARRIEMLVREPLKAPLPSVVLGLLRVVILLLGGDRITVATPAGDFMPKPMKYPGDIEWVDAMRVLRRSNKFLRRLRVLSSGPAAKRPRLMHVPLSAARLYQAYETDPDWRLQTMISLDLGGRCAGQLFSWVVSLMEVMELQKDFLHEIGGADPLWISRHQEYCRRRRELSLDILIKDRFCGFIQSAMERDRELERFMSMRQALHADQLRAVKELKAKLAELEKEELAEKTQEVKAETATLTKIQEEISDFKAALKRKQGECAEAEEKAQHGNKVQELRVPLVLQEIDKLQLALRELNTSLELHTILHERSQSLRSRELQYSGDVIMPACVVGEAEGAVAMFKADAEVLKREIQNKRCDPRQTEEVQSSLSRDFEELRLVTARLQSADDKLRMARKELQECIGRFNKELQRVMDDHKTKEDAGLRDWGEPTTDEISLDQAEDQRLAMEETTATSQWIPRELIESRQFPEARPLLICVARDVPSWSKRRIFNRLTSEMAGMFIRVSSPKAMGLDIPRIQAVISTGSSAVADVDAGLCVHTRRRFLEALGVVKKAVIPSPQVVLLLGHNDNAGVNLISGKNGHLGVSDDDYRFMEEEPLKRRLELARDCVDVLTCGIYREALEGLSASTKPPTNAYIPVIEAMVILFSSNSTFRPPARNVAAASWFSTKRCLSPFGTFCAFLRAVDKYAVPPDNLLVLEEYLAHKEWPRDVLREADPVLWYLTTWTQAVVEAAVFFRGGEGAAPLPDRRSPEGLLSGVVRVSSAPTELQEDDESTNVGWRSAYAATMSYVLDDRRCIREAKKLNDELYTVTVHQFGRRIFFSAYAPKTSSYRHASVLTKDISMLLSPGSFEPLQPGWDEPPATHAVMCRRLVALLSVEQISERHGQTRELVCRRKLHRLLRDSRRISGHHVALSIFEETKGELRVIAYLPKYSITISYLVNSVVLQQWLPNRDEDLEQDVDSEDIRRRVLPISQRLHVTPSRRSIETMGLFLPTAGPTVLCPDLKAVSRFQIRARRHGGPGRKLFQCVRKLSRQGPYAITCFEAGHHGALRIRIYKHQSSREQEIRMTPSERAYLLGGTSADGWREWKKRLIERLVLRTYAAVDEGSPRASREASQQEQEFRQGCVVLNREMFAVILLQRGGPMLRLTVHCGTRGASVLISFTVSGRGQRYEKTVTWTELLAVRRTIQECAGINGSPDTPLVMDEEARRGLFEGIAAAAKYDGAQDAVVLDGAFGGMLLGPTCARRMDQEIAYKDPQLEQYLPSEAIPNLDAPSVATLVDSVALSRRQASMQTYCNELGEQTPVHFRPTKVAKHREATIALDSIGGQDEVWRPLTAPEPAASAVCAEPRKRGRRPSRAQVETVVFNQGVKVQHELHLERTWFATVNLKVLVSYVKREGSPPSDAGDGGTVRRLRFVVYRLGTSAKAEIVIEGTHALKEVVGGKHQHLLAANSVEAMMLHIAHSRLTVMEGLWNPETDRYEPEHDQFTVILARDRRYTADKQTPLHLGANADEKFNEDKLIEDRPKRGRKILRCARNISGILLHLTVFEIPDDRAPRPEAAAQEQRRAMKDAIQLEREAEEAAKIKSKPVQYKVPQLRILSYDPQTGDKSVHMPHKEAVLENVGGVFSLLLEPTRRRELASTVVSCLILRNHELVLPYSRDPDVRLLKGIIKENNALEEQLLHIPGRLVQMTVSVRAIPVTITVFKVQETPDMDGALRLNFCSPGIGEAVDLVLTASEQIDSLGRPVLDYHGKPLELALQKLVDRMEVTLCDDPEEKGKQRLSVDPAACKNKPWLRSFQRLKPRDATTRDRPRGQPLVFIPASLSGNLLWRRGMKISGTEVLFTVSTKAKGLSPAAGLVMQAYDPYTCTNATLHVGRSELLRHVDGKEELLRADRIDDTIEMVLYRLKLSRHPVNGVVLELRAPELEAGLDTMQPPE